MEQVARAVSFVPAKELRDENFTPAFAA